MNCTGDCHQGRRACTTPEACSQGHPWPVKSAPKLTREQEQLMGELDFLQDVARGIVTGIVSGLLIVGLIALISL